jgi:hypothetical protein
MPDTTQLAAPETRELENLTDVEATGIPPVSTGLERRRRQMYALLLLTGKIVILLAMLFLSLYLSTVLPANANKVGESIGSLQQVVQTLALEESRIANRSL